MRRLEINPDRSFTPAHLPWVLAAGALVIYILTLNHWLALNSFTVGPYASNSMFDVARLSGWAWQPMLMEPLYWLVTYPIRFLPEARIPLALNLMAALFAAATLWQLARSIAILPHDRTEDQRQRERNAFAILSAPLNWVAPVAGVLVCALQLSFWENATSASGEMFNLLLFAYVARCLLEFRLDERESWLSKAAFVFSAAMTNNWGMIGYFPLFVAALVWLKRLSFFQARFLGRMALWSLAGLLFYLLLPIVAVISSNTEVGFWQALKYNIGSQKGLLSSITFNKQTLFMTDRPLWILGLPSLLPLLVMSIRWPSYFGDPSRLGVALATIIFHFFHAVLFVVCLWVMLDPAFSPRYMLGGTPLLSLYYLCALAIGYLAGYFVLIFGVRPSSRQVPGLPPIPIVDATVLVVSLLLLALVPAAAIYRNLPAINSVNGRLGARNQTPAREYAEACAVALPKDGSVVLSDDPRKLSLVRSVLTERGTADKFLFIDTQSLAWPDYHAYLAKEQPKRWKNFIPKDAKGQVDDRSLIQVLLYLSQSNSVYYLHPSFGYYFEAFWMEPYGLSYRLQTHTTNSLLGPPLSKSVLAYNQEFWDKAAQNAEGRLLGMLEKKSKQDTGMAEKLLRRAHLKKPDLRDASVIASFYSRARNNWAVEAQKAGQWEEGTKNLDRALALNPDNLVAKVNLEFNQHHQTGEATPNELSEDAVDLFGKYRTWDHLMNENGPFDEPRFCFEQGRVYVRGNLYRQAAHQFQRVRELAPAHLQTRMWLAQVCVLTRWPDMALELVGEMKSNAEKFGLTITNAMEIMSIESSAYLLKGQASNAMEVVELALRNDPQNEELLAAATQLFMNQAQFTNALVFIERQLRMQPDSPPTLVNKGFALLQAEQYDQAVPPLTRALELETNTASDLRQSALFNRAIAYLQGGKLEDAERDYSELQKNYPTAYKLYFGLAEIAYRKKETNNALRQYSLYLANAPTNTPEADFVRTRIKELKRGRP